MFVGFSVYNTIDPGMYGGDEFVRDYYVEYYFIIGEKKYKKVEVNLVIEDNYQNDKMADIFIENPIQVKSKEPITIAARCFFKDDRYVCLTWRGGGRCDNHGGAFTVRESEEDNRGENDISFGNLPRIFYIWNKFK